MPIYTVTIKDEIFGECWGEFDADTPEQAGEQAKDFYAYELDTYKDCIEVVSVIVKP